MVMAVEIETSEIIAHRARAAGAVDYRASYSSGLMVAM